MNSFFILFFSPSPFFQSDLGAPLLCTSDPTGAGGWRVHGVLSREGACRPAGHPDVYASVPDARAWIDTVVQGSGN